MPQNLCPHFPAWLQYQMEVVRIVGRAKVETEVEVVRGVAEVLTEGEVVRMAEGVVGPGAMVVVATHQSLISHLVLLIAVKLTGSLIASAPWM